MNFTRSSIIFVAFLALFSASAFANTIIFSDNFNMENGGVGALNYSGFSNWTITNNGAVDLIGNGFFDFLPGNGLYIDLDGSMFTPGRLTSDNLYLTAGLYELQFDIAGNQRAYIGFGSDTVTVKVEAGPLVNIIYALDPYDPFVLKTEQFQVTSPGFYNISFQNAGGDDVGALLDNVQLSRIEQSNPDLSPVPEPTSLILLGTGLGAIALIARRKQN